MISRLSKIFALLLGNKKKFLALAYRECLDIPVKDLKPLLGSSYQSSKYTVYGGLKSYDRNLLCKVFTYAFKYDNIEVYSKAGKMYVCNWCGRVVKENGRVKHLIRYHKKDLRKLEKEFKEFLASRGESLYD